MILSNDTRLHEVGINPYWVATTFCFFDALPEGGYDLSHISFNAMDNAIEWYLQTLSSKTSIILFEIEELDGRLQELYQVVLRWQSKLRHEQIGFYRLVPQFMYWPIVRHLHSIQSGDIELLERTEQQLLQWVKLNNRNKFLANVVDYLCPTIYLPSLTAIDVWWYFAKINIEEALRLSNHVKPILMPVTKQNEPIPSHQLTKMIQWIAKDVDDVLIFSASSMNTDPQWIEAILETV